MSARATSNEALNFSSRRTMTRSLTCPMRKALRKLRERGKQRGVTSPLDFDEYEVTTKRELPSFRLEPTSCLPSSSGLKILADSYWSNRRRARRGVPFLPGASPPQVGLVKGWGMPGCTEEDAKRERNLLREQFGPILGTALLPHPLPLISPKERLKRKREFGRKKARVWQERACNYSE